jgi:hypothetical protein
MFGPMIQVNPYASITPTISVSGNTPVYVAYHVGARYDWTGGPGPYSNARSWTQWQEPLSAMSSPIGVSGSNNSASQTDTFRIFAAGILLGVAGGALIAAMQEFAHRKERAPTVQASDGAEEAS